MNLAARPWGIHSIVTCRALTVLLALLMTLAGLSPAAADQQTVSIGIVADNKPYSDMEGRTPSGFSVDVLREVASNAGLSFEFRAGSWPEIYNAFMDGQLDAIDGISYQEDRARTTLFTRPYHVRQTYLMHDTGNPVSDVLSVEDLRSVRLGVVRDIYYRDYLEQNDIGFTTYESIPALVRALAFGWVDVIIGPELTLQYYANQAGFRFLDIIGRAPLGELSREDFRIGVRKDKPELFQQILSGLEAVPHERIRELLERWQEYGGASINESRHFALSNKQQQYVQEAGPLRVGLMSDYAPFSFQDGGRSGGLTVDVLHRISDLTGLQFTPVSDQWAELFPRFKAGDLDIMANISHTSEREAFTRFTEPYHIIPTVAFTRNTDLSFEHLEEIEDLNIGYSIGIFYEQALKQRLADQATSYNTQEALFQALADGKEDVVFAALPNGNYWIRELGIQGVSIAGELKLDAFNGEDLRFGVRPELEPAAEIMDLALAAISPAEMRTIEDRWLGASDARPDNGSDRIIFTPGQQTWLNQRDFQLDLCVSPDSMPMEGINSQGEHTGFSGDVFRLFSRRSGIHFQLHPTETWKQSLEKVRQRECDLLSLAMETPERLSFLNFTDPYLILPVVILGRIETPFFERFEEMEGRTLGVIEDFAFIDLLGARYPDIQMTHVASEVEGLRLLQQGQIDGYITTQVTASHYMQTLELPDLKVIGRAPFNWDLSVATRNDEPLLLGIMQKLVDSLDEQERTNLETQWRTVRVEQEMDYTLVWQVTVIAIVILALLFYWNRKLGRLNSELAVANAQLAHLSVTDELTQLGNRSYFDQQLGQSFQWCQRHNAGFALAMVDADHFKTINDTHGHQAGDQCLIGLAEAMGSLFRRETDHLARFGGEEFVILATYNEPEEIIDRLETLRQQVEDMSTHHGEQAIQFTISIGLALGIAQPEGSPEDFLQAADQALYQAKAEGRNRLQVKRVSET